MSEIIQAAFSGVNLVYTILLIVMLVYWCIVLLGVIDLDPLGIDLDVDAVEHGRVEHRADAAARRRSWLWGRS